MLKGDDAVGMALLWIGGALAGMILVGTIFMGVSWLTFLIVMFSALITMLGVQAAREGI